MRPFSFRATCSAASLALIAASGCGDRQRLTGPYGGIQPSRDLSSATTPVITALDLGTDTLVIFGPSVPFTATLENPGPARTGANLQGLIIQAGTQSLANQTVIDCGSGSGVLPTGTCTISSKLAASGPGASTLVPGNAVLLMLLRDSTGLLDSAQVIVRLTAGAPTLSDVSVGDTTVTIGGLSVPFTATVQNPGPSLAGVLFQGTIRQGSTQTSAAGGSVNCGSGSGILPTGTCTFSSRFVASNALGGPLVPGPASFELHVFDSTGTVQTTKTVAITLVALVPKIASLTPSTDTLVIDVTRPTYAATIQNQGASLSNMVLRGFVSQDSTRHSAGSIALQCPVVSDASSDSTCTVSGTFFAFDTVPGTGTFVAGPATFQLQLLDSTGTVVSTASVPVRLFARPSLTSVRLSKSFLKIGGGPSVSLSLTAENPGPSLPAVTVTYSIIQGTARRAGGPAFSLTLPSGATTLSGSIVADNSQPGQGTLVPGLANVEVVLTYDSSTVIDRRLVQVTLK